MFYDKTLKLMATGQGYVDESGIYHVGQETELKLIPCDIQPYSSELLFRDYGYQEQVTKRVFCDVDPNIKNGMIVTDIADVRYKIKKIIPWDDYLDVMINEE